LKISSGTGLALTILGITIGAGNAFIFGYVI